MDLLRRDTTPAEGWRHRLASSFADLQSVPVDDEEVGGSLVEAHLGEVGVFQVSGTPQQVRRSTSATRAHPLELLKVCLITSGTAVVEQDAASQVPLGPGDFALYDISRPYQITLQPDWSCLVMTVPRVSLGLPDGALRLAMSRPHSAGGTGQLLHTFLRESVRVPAGTATASMRAGEAGIALLAGALADHDVRACDVGLDELRHQVVAWVRQHLHDPDLSTDRIARALHMSTRALQRLFEHQDFGVAGLVRQLRLDAVRRDLGDPALARHTIMWIAARWGITNAPWLAKAFRAQYGVSPSEYRRAATE